MARLIFVIALASLPLHAEEFTYTESDSSGNNIALGFPPPQPVDTTVAGDYFRSYDYLLARHQELMLGSATIRGYVVGETWKGSDIWLYRFGDEDDTVVDGYPEGAVLINGSIHAREWQTQEATTGLMEHLAAIQQDGGIGTYLSEHLDVLVLPVHNIDGFRQTQKYWNKVVNSEQQPRDGRMRRKSMRTPSDSTVDDLLDTAGDAFYGVDLNRNGEHGFAMNNGSSGDPTSLIYRGTAPASEPESRALLAAMELIAPERLRFYEDVHSYSQLMYVPQTGDEVRDEIARSLAYGMSNAVGGHYDVFPDPVGHSMGTTSEYFAYTYQVPSWTLELEPHYNLRATQYGGVGVSHDGFILPESEVARLRSEFNRMHIAVFYEMAGPAFVQKVEIRRMDDSTIVYSAHWQPIDSISRDLVITVDETLQPETAYEIWVAMSKPMHATDAGSPVGGDIHLVDEDGSEQLLVAGPPWLASPGGSFEGYNRYRHDAFRSEFFIENDVPADGSAERRMLIINVTDFVNRLPDADPATIAGFSDGKWVSYEPYPGAENEVTTYGNPDCNFVISVGSDPGQLALPVDNQTCSNYLNPPPTPTVTSGKGSGGGSLFWSLLALALVRLHKTSRR